MSTILVQHPVLVIFADTLVTALRQSKELQTMTQYRKGPRKILFGGEPSFRAQKWSVFPTKALN